MEEAVNLGQVLQGLRGRPLRASLLSRMGRSLLGSPMAGAPLPWSRPWWTLASKFWRRDRWRLPATH